MLVISFGGPQWKRLHYAYRGVSPYFTVEIGLWQVINIKK